MLVDTPLSLLLKAIALLIAVALIVSRKDLCTNHPTANLTSRKQVVVVVPSVVVTQRNNDKASSGNELAANAAFETTVIDGQTVTRARAIRTLTALSTQSDGNVATVLETLTEGLVTISHTEAGQVQNGELTVLDAPESARR